MIFFSSKRNHYSDYGPRVCPRQVNLRVASICRESCKGDAKGNSESSIALD